MIKYNTNCSNCAYCKKKMGGIVCNNSQSPMYERVVNHADSCEFGTGREDDGFVTHFKED